MDQITTIIATELSPSDRYQHPHHHQHHINKNIHNKSVRVRWHMTEHSKISGMPCMQINLMIAVSHLVSLSIPTSTLSFLSHYAVSSCN